MLVFHGVTYIAGWPKLISTWSLPRGYWAKFEKVYLWWKMDSTSWVLEYLLLSYPILSCPILSYPVLSCSILSYPVLSCPILSYPVLSCPIPSIPSILSYPILSIYFSIDVLPSTSKKGPLHMKGSSRRMLSHEKPNLKIVKPRNWLSWWLPLDLGTGALSSLSATQNGSWKLTNICAVP